MKTKLLTFMLLLWAATAFAQTQQKQKPVRFDPPTEIGGFKVRYATLSKGKYQEIFTNDTIQRIGAVYFNRVTGEIVGEVVKDSLYYPAGVSARWWSPDPLAGKFPEQSPYNFVENNPINMIDPDGREPVKPNPYQVEWHLRTTQSPAIFSAVQKGRGFGFNGLSNVVNGGGNWNRAVGAFAEGVFADRLENTVAAGSGLMGGIKGLFSASNNTRIYMSPEDPRYTHTDVLQTVRVGEEGAFTYPILQDLQGSEKSKTVGKGDYTFLYEVKASDSDFTMGHLTSGINQLISTMDKNKGSNSNLIPILVVDGSGFANVLNQIAQSPHSKSSKDFINAFNTLTEKYNGGINIEQNLKKDAVGKLIEFKTDVNKKYK